MATFRLRTATPRVVSACRVVLMQAEAIPDQCRGRASTPAIWVGETDAPMPAPSTTQKFVMSRLVLCGPISTSPAWHRRADSRPP